MFVKIFRNVFLNLDLLAWPVVRSRSMAAEARTAEEQLIEDHISLVRQIAWSMSAVPMSIDRDDMISAGFVALIECARRYDSSRGYTFKTYAKRRIEGAMQDYLRTLDWCPRSVRRTVRAAKAAQDVVGYNAPLEKVAEELGMTRAKLGETLGKARKGRVRSLDVAVSEDVAISIVEALEDRTAREIECDLLQTELKSEIARLLDILNEQQRIVIQRTFFDGAKYRQVARELGVSESRIAQVRTAALGILREHIETMTGS